MCRAVAGILEYCHHSVAREPFDPAAKPGNGFAHVVEDVGDDQPPLLEIHGAAESRRLADIGEKHSYEFAGRCPGHGSGGVR